VVINLQAFGLTFVKEADEFLVLKFQPEVKRAFQKLSPELFLVRIRHVSQQPLLTNFSA